MEEIIIDGVNVAGCYWKCKDGDCAMYYADLSADNNELEFGFNCEDNTDCYFKQLKRLEQENRMLQELKDEDSLRVVQLAKENAELKERKDKYYQRTLDLEIVVSEYQQALEEIREMTKAVRYFP